MIEIQIHPSDIRRKVRYFFLDRRAVLVGTVVLASLLSIVLLSMAAAPSVIRRVYKVNFLDDMRSERKTQQKTLESNVAEMRQLGKTLDEQQLRVAKLIAIYNLGEPGVGQGGLASRRTDSVDLDDAQSLEAELTRTAAKLQQDLEKLRQYEQANADVVRHTPSIMPVPHDQFVLTSPFGSRISPFTKAPDFHKGLDLSAPTGTPIYASADGVVTFAGRYPLGQSVAWWRFGNVVVISHGDRFLTIYGHCDTTLVRAGQTVRQGQQVATVGSTGWSTNSHLHYEVRTDLETPGTYEPIDPRIYILDYRWKNEEQLLINRRTVKEYRNLDPLPSAFVGNRRG